MSLRLKFAAGAVLIETVRFATILAILTSKAIQAAGWLTVIVADAVVVALSRPVAAWRLWRGRPAALWASTPILVTPILARCVERLGWRSRSLVFQTYRVTSAFDLDLSLWEARFHRRARALHPAFRRAVLYWALLNYDAFHYFHDQGLLAAPLHRGVRLDELRLLRRAGKRVYLAAYGADVRTRRTTTALGEPNCCSFCPAPGRFCVCDETPSQARMSRRNALATARMTTAEMGLYDPEAWPIHYWPVDVARMALAPPTRREGPLKVFHAPNHPHFKGTAMLRAAVAALKARGVEIDYRELSGVSNAEVIAAQHDADLVADQFIIGAYGYAALEAMAAGKPVLCFLRRPDWLAGPDCPILSAGPADIERVLEACANDEIDLAAVGRASRAWVSEHYDLEAVSRRIGRLYLATGGWTGAVARRLERSLEA